MYVSDLRHRDAALEQKLQNLYALNRGKSIDLSFRPPYLELLKKFGNPHLKLPPVIHVAGTNGKGSVIATLKSILEAGGYKVHAYTSPHLVDFNERIYLAGKNIGNDELDVLIDEAIMHNDGNEITFFEITTAMAFAAFSRTPADILLLETGMGGRLDCTNVVENPLATIITSIGFDHTEHLGDTIEKITSEKAGIMKTRAPCIISAQQNTRVTNILKNVAAEKNVAITESALADSALPGAHQRINAGAVIAALKAIKEKFPLQDDTIRRGLENISWPARLQNLTAQFEVPDEFKIWLDGAHNEDAAQALLAEIKTWETPAHLIFAMLRGKNPRRFLEILRPGIASLHLVDIPDEPKALPAAELASTLQNFSAPLHLHETYEKAVQEITRREKSGNILIAGSLYLAGHVLKTLRN